MSTTIPATPTGIADTNDWDGVFALPYPYANLGIAQNWPSISASVSSISISEDGFTLTGEFGPWQIAPGGSGDLVQLACPFISGTFSTASATSYPLAPASGPAAVAIIQVRMEWVPNSNQKAFAVSGATVPPIVTALGQGTVPAALSEQFTANKVALQGQVQVVQRTAGIEWGIIDAAENNYFVFFTTDKYGNQYLDIYQQSTAWLNQLNVLANAASTDQPAVVLQQIQNNPVPPTDPISAAVLPSLLSNWFNSNIMNFTHVFATLDLVTQIDTSNAFSWMSPSDTGYAVIDTNIASQSVFAVLTMVENNDPPLSMQVSLNAIPAGADAGFLISGAQFVQNMLLPGACAIFNNAPSTDFTIGNDGLSVTNPNPVVWGNFTLSDTPLFTVDEDFTSSLNAGNIPTTLMLAFTSNGYPLLQDASVSGSNNSWLITSGSQQYALGQASPSTAPLQVFQSTQLVVPANGFGLTLNDTYLEIQFQGIVYPYNDDYNVTLSYTDQFSLSLSSQNGGNNVLLFTSENPNISVTVEKTTLEVVEEIVLGALAAALALLAIVGPLAEGLINSARGGATIAADGSAGTAEVGATALREAEAANPEAAAQGEQDAGTAAANTAKGGRWSSIKAALKLPRWKLVGRLAGISGLAYGSEKVWDAVEEAAVNDDFSSVPSFNTFATKMVSPYSFPALTGFQAVSAQLNGSLQIGYNVTTSTTPATASK